MNAGATLRGEDQGLRAKLVMAARDIKLAHSIFAMPFAILASFLARPSEARWSRFVGQLALVVACMVAARTWAMMVNRIADRAYDAANPRTARRAVASGRLGLGEARLIAAGAAGAFVGVCGLFAVFYGNIWPLALAGLVLGWIALYSYTKRFTALCHVFLGGALAVSPLAAAIAIDPTSLTRTPALYFVAGFVLVWVAGFDVIYALQDVGFDVERGLHSIPSKLGPERAIVVSRVLHAVAMVLLIAAWRSDARFGVIFGAACVMVFGLLVAEHTILAKRGRAGLNMAFFTVNGVVSCVVGAAGVWDSLV